MLTIEQNDEDKRLEVSVSCDDCESPIHPVSWIDTVHCRCGLATCDESDNHDGVGCFILGECECLPLHWSEHYQEAIEIYFGQHPEAKGYKVIGLYESEEFEGSGEFDDVGSDPKESLKYAVANTVLGAAHDAGLPWSLKYAFAGAWEKPLF